MLRLCCTAEGAQTDLMESYFLSETVKYLYLSFVDSAPLLDYYLLSTEGHLMPVFPHASESHISGLHETKDSSRQQQDDSLEGCSDSSSSSPAEEVQAGTCSSSDNSSSSSRGYNSSSTNPTCSLEGSKQDAVPVNTSDSHSSSLVGKPLQQLPTNCWELCAVRAAAVEDSLERRLRAALPLLPVKRISSRRIRWTGSFNQQHHSSLADME